MRVAGGEFPLWFIFFFFNDTATTEIYTLSLHDALPISNATTSHHTVAGSNSIASSLWPLRMPSPSSRDRKSTRLNSSHGYISYAVFCLKKKKETESGNLGIPESSTDHCSDPTAHHHWLS